MDKWQKTSAKWNDYYYSSIETCEIEMITPNHYLSLFKSGTIFITTSKKDKSIVLISIKYCFPSFPNIFV